MKILLIGAPGVGKGSQATILSKTLNVPHISLGDIFRANISAGTPLGMAAKSYMDRGALVPDETTIEIVQDRIRQDDCKNGFILDGFPRTIQQAEALDRMLQAMDLTMDAIVNIELEDHVILERLTGRRVCEQCNQIYHISDKPPKTSGICDVCGTPLSIRKDDSHDVIARRLETYHSQTKPILAYYKSKAQLLMVRSEQDINQTTKNLFEKLGLNPATAVVEKK